MNTRITPMKAEQGRLRPVRPQQTHSDHSDTSELAPEAVSLAQAERGEVVDYRWTEISGDEKEGVLIGDGAVDDDVREEVRLHLGDGVLTSVYDPRLQKPDLSAEDLGQGWFRADEATLMMGEADGPHQKVRRVVGNSLGGALDVELQSATPERIHLVELRQYPLGDPVPNESISRR